MSSQTWLVSGASRGIGRGFVETLLQRPNTTVIAAVRTPNAPNIETLRRHPTAEGSKVIVVKIDSEVDIDPLQAMETLQKEHNITHLDVAIANAAVTGPPTITSQAAVSDFRRDFQNNTIAPLLLFQATWPLLQKSRSPKFIGITTSLATIGKMEDFPLPMASYGASKAAMNYVVRKMHFEHEGLIAFVVHPGWVRTDAGNAGAKAMGMEEAPDTITDSVNWILEKIDNAAERGYSGSYQFYGHEGDYTW